MTSVFAGHRSVASLPGLEPGTSSVSVVMGRWPTPADEMGSAAGPLGRPLLPGGGERRVDRISDLRACRWRPGIFNPGIFAGCVVAARAHGDQVIGDMSVTVVVRSVPGLTVRCGTRVARPARTICLAPGCDGRQLGRREDRPGDSLPRGLEGQASGAGAAEQRFLSLRFNPLACSVRRARRSS
jgi:hypothetical protein